MELRRPAPQAVLMRRWTRRGLLAALPRRWTRRAPQAVLNRCWTRRAPQAVLLRRWTRRATALLLAACFLLSACGGPSPTVFLTPRPSVTPSGSPAPTSTQTPTITPTRTATPTTTFTPTPTATTVPVSAGTQLPATNQKIIELTLPRLRVLSQWGRGRTEGLAWSPDGQRLAVATPLGVYLYDPNSLSDPTWLQTRAPAYRLAWAPDSKSLAVDTAPPGLGVDTELPPHQIEVWDLARLDGPRSILESKTQALAIAYRDGNELDLLVSSQPGSIFQRWNLATTRLTQATSLSSGEADPATAADFTTDFTRAATHAKNGPVRFWQLSSGASLGATKDTGEAAGPLAFSPDGKLLAAAYPDETRDFQNSNQVRVWRFPARSGEAADLAYSMSDPTRPEGADEKLLSLAWAHDQGLIAAGFADQTVHIWRLSASPVFRRIDNTTLPAHIAFDPTGMTQTSADSTEGYTSDARLAISGLEVWRVSGSAPGSPPEPVASDRDYLPVLFDMQFTPNSAALALAEYEQIDFRSVVNGTSNLSIGGMDGAVYGLSFDAQGNYFVAACQDGTTRLYLARNGRYLASLGEAGYPVRTAAFSPHGFWIASASEDMRIRVFRLDDGQQINGFTEPYVSYKLLFSPNNNQLASLTTSGVNLRLVEGTERANKFTLQGTVGGVGLSDMVYSPGQEYLALVGNGVVRVITPGTRKTIYIVKDPNNAVLPWSVAFSPDNAFLAVGWSDGSIRFYWAQTGDFKGSWQGHPETVQRLAFSRDGLLLASMGQEGTIRMWGIEE